MEHFESVQSIVNKNYLNGLIKKRRNIKYFSDKIPDKDIIKQILNDTLVAAPAKNNIYHYSLEVWGPEFEQEKKSLLIQTLCLPRRGKESKNHFMERMRRKGWYVGDIDQEDIETMTWKEQKKLYDEEILHLNTWDLEDIYREWKVNAQVMAPYLLVYKLHKNKYIPERLQNHPERLQNHPNSEKIKNLHGSERSIKEGLKNAKWSYESAIMQASMHSMILSLYASYYDIDHGFCRCFSTNMNPVANEKNIIFNEPKENLIFFLGLGYRGDEDKLERRMKKNIVEKDRKHEKPKPEQIYQWM